MFVQQLSFLLTALMLYFSQLVECEKLKTTYSWRLGNSADFKLPDESALNGGIVLAGGSTDVDEAMRWFLRKALGGDVLVFRNAVENSVPADYPTADAYNSYFFSELGVDVNSVETILFNSRDVANDPIVYEKVRQAEAIFFTGGDQSRYYLFSVGTLLHDAFNYFINVKHGVIGGTSAGCAIQSEFIFSAENDSIISQEALKNPYDNKMTIRNNFLAHKLLLNTITDTHFYNRDREGRMLAFMGRIIRDNVENSIYKDKLIKGIGVDEKTAVCVEANGRAYVFGSGDAYFFRQNTVSGRPEICEPGKTFDWYRERKAVRTYRIKGTTHGQGYFDLISWNEGSQGTWLNHYVNRGKLYVDYV